MSKQSNSDITDILASAYLALKALEPAVNKYKRVVSSDHYTVGTHILAAKSCLQNLISEAEKKLKASTQEACQASTSVPMQDPHQVAEPTSVVRVIEEAPVK
jgi:hypothetical protein